MNTDLKQYLYHRGRSEILDGEFRDAAAYDNIKLGKTMIFWKTTLRWFAMPLSNAQRVYRRVEEVGAKMCCGRANFDIQKLMLVLCDGTTLAIPMGDGLRCQAAELFAALQETHPELKYGKE